MNAGFRIDTSIAQDVMHEFNGTHERISRQVLNTAEEGVRKALVDMGWTPPGETPRHYPPTLVTELLNALLVGGVTQVEARGSVAALASAIEAAKEYKAAWQSTCDAGAARAMTPAAEEPGPDFRYDFEEYVIANKEQAALMLEISAKAVDDSGKSDDLVREILRVRALPALRWALIRIAVLETPVPQAAEPPDIEPRKIKRLLDAIAAEQDVGMLLNEPRNRVDAWHLRQSLRSRALPALSYAVKRLGELERKITDVSQILRD